MSHNNSDSVKKTVLLTGKILLVGFLVLLMLIPLSMVDGLVRERSYRKNAAIYEIQKSWGASQLFVGPVVVIPYIVHEYSEYIVDGGIVKKEKGTYQKQIYFLPKNLDVKVSLDPQIRYRGIYKAVLYTGNLSAQGELAVPDFSGLNIAESDILWDSAYVLVGLSDLSVLQGDPKIKIGEEEKSFVTATPEENFIGQGLKIPFGFNKTETKSKNLAFNIHLIFSGSDSFQVLPIGDNNRVSIDSSWGHPGFIGDKLPIERKITADGFTGIWNANHIGRSIASRLSVIPKELEYKKLAFGCALVNPVDVYQIATRSVKYGSLYIFLTFVVFFLFEVLNRLRIHAVQYLLVGFAIALFYLLLIAISEHISFAISYVLASSAITVLLTYYSYWTLRSFKSSSVMSLLVGSLFGFLYILLCAEDYALVMGAVGLLLILSVIMFVTRKLDWYQAGRSANE